MRKLGLTLILITLALTSGCGLLTVADWNVITYNGTWEQEYDFTGEELIIEGFNGIITVDVWEEPRVEVEAMWTAKVDNYTFSPAVKEDEEILSIVASRSDRDLSGANFMVSVPRGINLVLKTSNGRVSVSGHELADLSISSSNGAAMVESPGTGRLTIHTSNGMARISEWCGDISCTTSNGAITAIICLVTEGEYSFTTSNGGISVLTNPESKFDLRAHTSNGGLSSPLQGNWSSTPVGTSYTGRYNGGGASLTVRTSNGSIQILPHN